MTGKRDRVTYRTSDRKAIRIAKHTSGRHGANESQFMLVTSGGRAVAQRHTRRVKTVTNKTYKGRDENYYKTEKFKAKQDIEFYYTNAKNLYFADNLSYSDKKLLYDMYNHHGEKAVFRYNHYVDILNTRFGKNYEYEIWYFFS